MLLQLGMAGMAGGGLKYWVANAGRLTLAQAVYLNQQDMLRTENEWHPKMLTVNYPFRK